MCCPYDRCSIRCNDPKIVVKENKSRFEVSNSKRKYVSKIQVDGCLFDEKNEKCDWIIEYDDPSKKALFVELKGCDLDKAISQLKSTLNLTRKRFNEHQKECYVVTTRIPKHGSTVRRKCIDFQKQTKATLSVKNLKFSLTI
ncbi:hypothetical protein [Oceanospirillum beijerinckii]|uniref:hypothetical protein n=1 Tax=Oceanospirillum beijerinckii TaxID=64976 RepID=UPI00055C08B5|nr:hypothetical protein [Oceanospirillum beijerinckii]